jgi:hypothetical protein
MTASASSRPAFVFVCQAGELEVKALLLAASLRRFLHGEHELITALPTPAHTWGELSEATREALQHLGVRLVPIVNPIDPAYPIGNKLACLDVPVRSDRIAFVDSDILCLRDWGDPRCLQADFAAKPADLRTFAAASEVWQPLYAAAGVALPRLRLPTTVSGEFGLAYFNSGVVCVRSGRGFGAGWIDCARAIDAQLRAHEQRHWLDQVALPIAVHKRGLRYAALDERFNFPAHLKPLGDAAPFLCHYHWPRIVRRELQLHALVCELAREHAPIARTMAGHAAWAALLAAPPRAPAPAARAASPQPARNEMLVLEIPGSGAPALAALLRDAGCTVATLPAETSAALAAHAPPWEVAAALRDVQAATLPAAGDANGETICAITADDPRWLCCLAALRRVLPTAQLVVCVRDPHATIRAWNETSAEPVDAMIDRTLAVAARWLPGPVAAELGHIATLDDAAEQRAAWWWWLAQRVIEQAGGVTVVRHAELGDPARLLGRLLPQRRMDASSVVAAPAAAGSDAREDTQAIDAICLQAAAELGVAD